MSRTNVRMNIKLKYGGFNELLYVIDNVSEILDGVATDRILALCVHAEKPFSQRTRSIQTSNQHFIY